MAHILINDDEGMDRLLVRTALEGTDHQLSSSLRTARWH